MNNRLELLKKSCSEVVVDGKKYPIRWIEKSNLDEDCWRQGPDYRKEIPVSANFYYHACSETVLGYRSYVSEYAITAAIKEKIKAACIDRTNYRNDEVTGKLVTHNVFSETHLARLFNEKNASALSSKSIFTISITPTISKESIPVVAIGIKPL